VAKPITFVPKSGEGIEHIRVQEIVSLRLLLT